MADEDKRPYHERYRPAPPPDYMRYLTAPFMGYWNRQGKMAREGLAMAEEGAQRARSGDLSGYLGMFLGPLGYASSPINALIPTQEEAYAAFDGNAAPLAAGLLNAASFGLPGPKVRGLGRGMSKLADDVTDAERAALQTRLQTEVGQAGGAANATSRDQALRNLTEAPPEGITAYHGSPHTFDRFDTSKIGTGEGAQAYGHGLYFAENEGVAKGYKGSTSNADFIRKARDSYDEFDSPDDALASLKASPDLSEGQKRLLTELEKDGWLGFDYPHQAVSAAIRQPHNFDLSPETHAALKDLGSMYQVRLNVKPDELLDWDRPLRMQDEGVRSALERIGIKGDPRGNSLRNEKTGGEILRMVGPAASAELTATLKAAGIKGIRYKDAGSRSGEGGTYNYVIFDDSLVTILKRYGIPMTAGAGGAVIVSGANMPPDIAAQLGPEA